MGVRPSVKLIGFLWIPAAWIVLSYSLHIQQAILPSPSAIVQAATGLEPNIALQTGYTASRFTIGFLGGTAVGIGLGLLLYASKFLEAMLMPFIQSSRSIPSVAIIPFFIIWFGFSETGRYLMVFAGTAFNVAVATLQTLERPPEKYAVMFKSFNVDGSRFPLRYGLPFVLESILPTLRFSLATAIGLIVASEMLGAQSGLGYLAQTARATFSMPLLMAVILLLGMVSAVADFALIRAWNVSVYWLRRDA